MKLALVGRDIAHSRSLEIYRRLFNGKINYTLLDYPQLEGIPSLSQIFDDYGLSGLNITAPYKKVFLKEIHSEKSNLFRDIGGINCIRKTSSGLFMGENTDYLAIESMLPDLISSNSFVNIIILGNGVMSKLTQIIMGNLNINYELLTRSSKGDLSSIDLSLFKEKTLIINACSRSFNFQGKLPHHYLFWDYNYDHAAHYAHIEHYLDGFSLLERQAEYAADFFRLSLVPE